MQLFLLIQCVKYDNMISNRKCYKNTFIFEQLPVKIPLMRTALLPVQQIPPRYILRTILYHTHVKKTIDTFLEILPEFVTGVVIGQENSLSVNVSIWSYYASWPYRDFPIKCLSCSFQCAYVYLHFIKDVIE